MARPTVARCVSRRVCRRDRRRRPSTCGRRGPAPLRARLSMTSFRSQQRSWSSSSWSMRLLSARSSWAKTYRRSADDRLSSRPARRLSIPSSLRRWSPPPWSRLPQRLYEELSSRSCRRLAWRRLWLQPRAAARAGEHAGRLPPVSQLPVLQPLASPLLFSGRERVPRPPRCRAYSIRTEARPRWSVGGPDF